MGKHAWNITIGQLGGTPESYLRRFVDVRTDREMADDLNAAGFTVTERAVRYRRQGLRLDKSVAPTSDASGPRATVQESKFLAYDQPEVMLADSVVVLPDIQAPYHHAEFINKVLDLCDAWNVRYAVLAGDVIENAALTSFSPNWATEPKSAIPDELRELVDNLPENEREKFDEVINRYDGGLETVGASTEWHYARREIRRIVERFDGLIWINGNHEARILKQLKSPMLPEDIKRLFVGDTSKVITVPHYHCIVESGGEIWRITHPNSSAKYDSKSYASKYLSHVAMAHSHHWVMQRDKSGQFYAVEMGCLVDERRLPYVSHRDSKVDSHALGALIIRDGHPWLLGEQSQFDLLKRIGT